MGRVLSLEGTTITAMSSVCVLRHTAGTLGGLRLSKVGNVWPRGQYIRAR
jgi:hypothetical protein